MNSFILIERLDNKESLGKLGISSREILSKGILSFPYLL